MPRRVGKSEQRLRRGGGPPRLLGARSDDTTLFGARGPDREGLPASRRNIPLGSDIVPEDIVSSESGDLAYMAGFERGEVSHDANAPMMITIRVTHIYRPINAEWCFVHRHADFPLSDQRTAGAGCV